MVSILSLEDSPIDLDLSLSLLRAGGVECMAQRVETESAFRGALTQGGYDLILADYSLPQFDGRSALKIARELAPDLPFVFVSGAMGEETAIDSLLLGATDYVLKQRLGRLAPAVKRALAEAAETSARQQAERRLADLLISERAARAEAETHARELSQVNAELEQFAFAVSHDLQEPLRTVRISAEMLARRCRQSLDENGLAFLGYIDQGVVRMEKLIKDLLSYSRTLHDKDKAFEPVDLGALVRETLVQFQQIIEETKAEVTARELPVVRGRRERLDTVFQNLISNSLKYRADTTPRIEISARREGQEWVICVEDNGIGFDPQHAQQIFGLFKRLHRDEYPGTGVGLALVKQIVEQHGGRIWAEGQPGVGARFCLVLLDRAG